jgi:hypothetical protein
MGKVHTLTNKIKRFSEEDGEMVRSKVLVSL